MNELLVTISVGFSVALFAWVLVRLGMQATDKDRRKLKNRLNSGQADRTATAEQRSIRNDLRAPGLEGFLLQFKPVQGVDAMLKQSMPHVELKKFLLVMMMASCATGLIVFAVTMVPLVGLVGMGLGGGAPLLVLVRKKIGRQRMLDDQLPDAMDFLGRALKAGHSLASGLNMMGNELPQPIAGEFSHAFTQHSLGVPMENVLKEMTRRIESTDFAFFVTAVLIQRQTGGDLSEVLKNISGMIRQRIRLQQQVKAKTAEGRFTGYLLTAFPAFMFVIMYMIKPDYAEKLSGTSLGQKLLAFAFIMQVLGLFAIKKITQVKV